MSGASMNGLGVRKDERGFALVVSMLILLVMTLLGLVLMSSVVLNRSLTGNDQRMRQSLNVAEAGVGEAEARVKDQDTQMDPANPRAVCQVFNTVAGSVPALGADSIGLATGQAAGTYLNYTTAGRSPNVLTIAWKKDPTNTKVMRYDGTASPAVNANTGLPIYVITATGRIGTATRTVVTEVIQKPTNVNVKGALAADVPISFVGNAVVCGYNHSADTPYDDGKNGRNSGPGGGPFDCIDNETSPNPLPGAWSTGSISGGGASGASGFPSGFLAGQVGFYAGPWEAFGISQADYFSWVGAPTTSPPDWNGIRYYDNNAVTQDRSASLALHSVNGEGYLYVDGDLRCNAGFHYKGLIYVEGDFDINGQAWILGGVIVKGQTSIKANGGMTILYSSDAINQTLAKYGGQFVTLSWREQ
jgi:Tfp pilus assembly protein PilX